MDPDVPHEWRLNPFVRVEMDNINLDVPRGRAPAVDEATSAPARRARGRPRVSAAPYANAIEKRRAQVRDAQRAYQGRKDDAIATEKRKNNAVIQVLSELSIEVEEILKLASNAGVLDQNDAVGGQMRRLRAAYDEAVNRPCVEPELKKLRIEHTRRRVVRSSEDNSNVATTTNEGSQEELLFSKTHGAMSTTGDLELGRVNDTTLIAPYLTLCTESKFMGGRSIFQVVSDRQAAMRNTENSSF
ncbi:hypothetical protein K505DRAFT_361253 [Melanomma pulvis-pyrius CBS 109.77]|uniref:BZIP domain-containing protein n=1 Tax=Melanomma pulvis-pyrius CBS 109.77 TaxID=1314802 RepID=A0A6A6XE07_9PLEO|nr:hypothetical protein K505DRAFT_361253 [Melanomma pulvis-pyrius CBS 109.77]